jgi:predicted dehydrogenase/nucleoside-diphosphate-sugar epimerase
MNPNNKNSQIRVGFLGTGYIADWHARAVRSVPGAALAAVCDRDPARAGAFAERHGVAPARAHASLDEMLAAGGLDAVHVLLPPEHHHASARALIDAGLHVLLEKPMCTTVEDCDALAEAARARGVALGVGHNFLFAEPHEQLKADLDAGRLGRPEHVLITWRKELGQLAAGPFDAWMLREPANILLEIGPHPVASLWDLLGPHELVWARASDPVDLPGGRRFYRRWQVEAEAGPTQATLAFSFGRGFTEHAIHVRGRLGSATVDLENGTYTLRRGTRYGLDLDRYARLSAEGAGLRAQARRNLVRYGLEKLKLSDRGNPYGAGIAGAVRAFYARLGGEPDPRVSARLGRDVVATCLEIGRRAGVAAQAPAPAAAPTPAPAPTAARPEILVLGATGFIGRELVRQLVAKGHAVRVLARDPARVPEDLRGPLVEVVRGDMARPGSLEAALEGIAVVYHLARAHAKSWKDYYEQDILVTQRLAELCLERGVRRLIYTGTIDSYYLGRGAGTITEQTPLDPRIARRNKYARAKAASEEILLTLHRERGLPVVIVRPAIVIGRGSSPLHWGVGMWSYDTTCQLWGRGEHGLPLVLVEDVAAALVAGLDAPGIEGEVFNLSDEPCVTARQYLEELERAAGVEFAKHPTPIWRFYAGDMIKWAVKVLVRHPERDRPSYRDWESRTQRAVFDCSKARRVLGWRPAGDRAELIRRGIHEPAAEFFS